MDKLKNIMTNSSPLPKGNPFNVPEGYFEALEDRIEARIWDEEHVLSIRTKVIHFIKPILGLAASFLLVYLLISYPLRRGPLTSLENKADDESGLSGSYIPDVEKDILSSPVYIDDNTFYEALNSEDATDNFEADEIISIVASEIGDYAVYAEIIY